MNRNEQIELVEGLEAGATDSAVEQVSRGERALRCAKWWLTHAPATAPMVFIVNNYPSESSQESEQL